jgi:hypothetical protein
MHIVHRHGSQAVCTHALLQTLTDGKPLIIEGLHLDPGLFIADFARQGLVILPAQPPQVPRASWPANR